MPPERQPTQKRRHLPFKPPSRSSSTAAGPSTSTTTKPKPKTTTSTSTTKKQPKKNAVASSSSSSSKPTAPRTSGSSSRRKPKSPSLPSSGSGGASDSGSESESDSVSRARMGSPSRPSSPSEGEPDYILAEITHNEQAEDVVSSEPVIPEKLLTRLLHHHFRNEKTKIAKDANAVVAKYIDVYVREAVARAAYERAEGGGETGVGTGFLEVEDLEKMGPQLAMDF